MSHYKRPLTINVYGTEVRVRRDRRAMPPALTHDGVWTRLKNAHPKGTGWAKWIADTWSGYLGYKGDLRYRKIKARMKRAGRRSALKKDHTRAMREQLDE